MNLGSIIRQRREKQNISLSELARRAGISKSYLHSIESGATENPSFDTVLRIAWELGSNPLTWWAKPDGSRFDADEWDVQTGKAWARYAFDEALRTMDEKPPDSP